MGKGKKYWGVKHTVQERKGINMWGKGEGKKEDEKMGSFTEGGKKSGKI